MADIGAVDDQRSTSVLLVVPLEVVRRAILRIVVDQDERDLGVMLGEAIDCYFGEVERLVIHYDTVYPSQHCAVVGAVGQGEFW